MATKSWLQLVFKTKRQSVATKISGREADDKDWNNMDAEELERKR